MSRTLLFLFSAFATAGFAQRPEPIASPEVHPDHSVTFRFRDPNAKEVLLGLEGAKPMPMQKDEQGIWSLTTAPLEPDFYGYSFVADGVGGVETQAIEAEKRRALLCFRPGNGPVALAAGRGR